LTPFWIDLFWLSLKKWKGLLLQVKNGFKGSSGWEMTVQKLKVLNSSWWRHSKLLRIFEILKKITSTIFLWIYVFKYQVSNDLDENWLNYGTFVSGGHLEFLHHFGVLFLRIHKFTFFGSYYQNMASSSNKFSLFSFLSPTKIYLRWLILNAYLSSTWYS
jgi:hypothetical protein